MGEPYFRQYFFIYLMLLVTSVHAKNEILITIETWRKDTSCHHALKQKIISIKDPGKLKVLLTDRNNEQNKTPFEIAVDLDKKESAALLALIMYNLGIPLLLENYESLSTTIRDRILERCPHLQDNRPEKVE
ncbi:MAG: hypothetical protein H6679_04480 [Epsilonproteobacteria bacterium]|nr:hypothetical protein [Campylobacterota bacterium]